MRRLSQVMRGMFESSEYQNGAQYKLEGSSEDTAHESLSAVDAVKSSGQPKAGEKQRRHKGPWRIMLAGLGANLIIYLLMTLVAISAAWESFCSFSEHLITVSSDDPIGDSREDAAFIASLEVNDRDLQVFDALRGCMDSLYEKRVARAQDSDELVDLPYSPDQMRAAIVAGTWPEDDADGNGTPRLWVRLAELSQIWLERETGGDVGGRGLCISLPQQ